MKIAKFILGLTLIGALGCAGDQDPVTELEAALTGSIAEQPSQAATRIDQDRKARLEANLRHQLRHQLQGQTVSVISLGPSDFEELDAGKFAVGQQSFSFLTSHDDTKFFVLATEPFNAGLSLEDIADELAAEKVATTRQARERAGLLSDATADLPFRGRADAPVTIVEFSDFQCPYCGRAFPTVEQILKNHPNDVKFVYVHFPLDMHPWAMPSAIAAVCAANQDQAAQWVLHDRFFQNQGDITSENVIDRAREFLSGTNVDLDAWNECIQDSSSDAHQEAVAAVNASIQLGRQVGVSGTPGFFVNGAFINGALPLETFEAAIQAAMEDPGD